MAGSPSAPGKTAVSRSSAGSSSAEVQFSATDVGFRAEGRKGTSVTGQFVVKIGGQWVDVEGSSFGPKLLTTVR